MKAFVVTFLLLMAGLTQAQQAGPVAWNAEKIIPLSDTRFLLQLDSVRFQLVTVRDDESFLQITAFKRILNEAEANGLIDAEIEKLQKSKETLNGGDAKKEDGNDEQHE
jgi:hypothetical protein